MARPKKIEEATPLHGTEPVSAPETAPAATVTITPPPQPRQMRIERQGARSEPYTRRFPQVRGGVCEYCGILDKNVPSQYQYKLCGHYRGMQLRCSYCSETKDPDEVIYHAAMNVAEHPDNPNMIIAWCDSYECSKAHNERFQRSRA